MANLPQVEAAEDRAATVVLGPASAEAAQRRRAFGALAVIGVAALLGGFFVGRLGGEDLDAARRAGAEAGRSQSTAASERAGYRAGFTEGRKAGYRETYKKAYKTAFELGSSQ